MPFALVDQFYFYMLQPTVRFGFLKKFILEHLHIVLKLFVSYAKAGNISQENGDVFRKIYYFNLMVSFCIHLILLLTSIKLASTNNV